MMNFKDHINDIPDFPIKGILYRDITPVLTFCFKEAIDAMESLYDRNLWSSIDHIAGIESRGFVFAAALAYRLDKGFLPIRKKGKLPNPAGEVAFNLEYGSASAEMQAGSGKVIIVDDLIATGGTILACAKLARQVGFEVVELCAFIDINIAQDLSFNGLRPKSVVQY